MIFNVIRSVKNRIAFRVRVKSIREPKVIGAVEFKGDTESKILADLKGLGVEARNFVIDLKKYREYFEKAGYEKKYPSYYSFNIHEKSLEHFIAAELLSLKKGEIYVDIASETSPVPEIYRNLFHCETYRQDLSYPAGINGDRIGCDASKMPVNPEFADKMALHCSFEHFEGEADANFIKEASRVLKPGGRCCIVPLYLFERYAIQTDPGQHGSVEFEPDAIIHCSNGWRNRHGRFYDAEHLKRRVLDNLNGLNYTVFRIVNAKDVHASCYVKFALLLEKPHERS